MGVGTARPVSGALCGVLALRSLPNTSKNKINQDKEHTYMAQNNIPSNIGQLIGLGNKMLMGLNSLGEALGITQITPAAFQAKLTAYTNGENAFAAARSALAGTYD